MGQRLELNTLLKTLMTDLLGKANVYFQPPPDTVMQYPCIVYQRNGINTDFADNVPYKHKTRYMVTVIDRSPDSEITEKVKELPLCSYDRFFTADNLNHDVFTLYF